METKNDGIKCHEIKAFKSYYVVWKRMQAWRSVEKRNKFKSYYVVWKLL